MSARSFLMLPLLALALAACGPNASAPGGAQSAANAPLPTCEAPALAMAVGSEQAGNIPAAQSYPANARYFCVNVAEGAQSVTFTLSGMSVDLDLYVGSGSLESVQGVDLQAGETYEWKSNALGTVDETVTIQNPRPGIYYAEIVSYEGQASDYRFSVR